MKTQKNRIKKNREKNPWRNKKIYTLSKKKNEKKKICEK